MPRRSTCPHGETKKMACVLCRREANRRRNRIHRPNYRSVTITKNIYEAAQTAAARQGISLARLTMTLLQAFLDATSGKP